MSSFNAWATTGVSVGSIESTGDITLAVSPSGIDNPSPVSNGDHSATPYLTIQGALSVLPAINNHEIVINVAAGTYDDTFTPPPLQGNGSLRIVGTFTAATLTTGVNVGVASAVVMNANGTWTITKPVAAANWTASNLRGKVFVITGGAGFPGVANQTAYGLISGNTTTTLTVTMFFQTGVSILNTFNPFPDATTAFQISDWATIIDAPIPSGYLAAINPTGLENKLSFEQLYCVGPGDENNTFCRATACQWVQYMANAFDGVANNGSAFYVLGGILTYAFGNYHKEGSICNTNTAQVLWNWGAVGDSNTAIIAQQVNSLSLFNNDFDLGNTSHGDSAYLEATDCMQIVDGFAIVKNGQQNAYEFQNCPDVSISSPILTSITGYAIAALTGPTNLVIDTKITGTAGNALLEDTAVNYSGAATGDSFQRGLSMLTYTGS
jgi:hypothetical protein